MQTKLYFDELDPVQSTPKTEEGWLAFAGIHETEMVAFLESRYGNIEMDVIYAVVFLNLFRKAGHICLPLDLTCRDWLSELEMDSGISDSLPESPNISVIKNSIITGKPGELKPFIIDDKNRLYLHKSWSFENLVAQILKKLSSEFIEGSVSTDIISLADSLFQAKGPENETDYQKIASLLSLYKKLIVLSGGPGTGKTTTIAKILALHLAHHGEGFRIALAAPTGKAAARMSEALTRAKDVLRQPDKVKEMIPSEAVTLHRLLQSYNTNGLLPDVKDPLPYDLIVIDEASMMDLTLAYKLLKNVGDHSSLILVGDRDQLASVEAGAVLADICVKKENGFSKELLQILNKNLEEATITGHQISESKLDDSVIYLEKNYRFGKDSGIGNLANAVKKENGNEAWNILTDTHLPDVSAGYSLTSNSDYELIFEDIFKTYQNSLNSNSASEALDMWETSVWLTPFRFKNPGVVQLNREFERYLSVVKKMTLKNPLFDGKPILITKNDYQLNLFNGDLGMIKTEEGITRAYFKTAEGSIKMVNASQLVHYEAAWFWTVHKSQGSEFDTVHLLLPKGESPILSKELIYTSVTRARNTFIFHGDQNTFIKAIKKNIHRFSGLSDKLKNSE